jgi:hypothetical protein
MGRQRTKSKDTSGKVALSSAFTTISSLMLHSLDYLFRLAVEMKRMGLAWVS